MAADVSDMFERAVSSLGRVGPRVAPPRNGVAHSSPPHSLGSGGSVTRDRRLSTASGDSGHGSATKLHAYVAIGVGEEGDGDSRWVVGTTRDTPRSDTLQLPGSKVLTFDRVFDAPSALRAATDRLLGTDALGPHLLSGGRACVFVSAPTIEGDPLSPLFCGRVLLPV